VKEREEQAASTAVSLNDSKREGANNGVVEKVCSRKRDRIT
jgi:hypothetical protein